MNSTAELDERGIVMTCPRCHQRNRLAHEQLNQTFRCGKCHEELRGPDEPVEVKSQLVFDALTRRSTLPVLVDFWAPWCGPCKMVAPEIAKVAGEGRGRWVVAKANTEELPELAQRLHITGIPTLALFRNGREVARQSGALPAPRICEFIEQH